MTLEEIRTEIRKEEWEETYRGALRISDDIHRLDNISITPTGNKTCLNAYVSDSAHHQVESAYRQAARIFEGIFSSTGLLAAR